MDIDGLLSNVVRDTRSPEYPASTAEALRMDGNTNLLGPNPAIRRAMDQGADRDLAHYPSGFQDELRSALAKHHAVGMDQILVGDGSDELIDVILRTFINPGDRVAFPVPTFVMYAFYSRLVQAAIVEVPLKPGFQLDLPGLANAKITFIASPNNPTGNTFPAADLESVLRSSRGLVVIDEAYADFCGQDFIRRLPEFENLIVIRTFSKAYGLAGLRVGYVVASKVIINRMSRIKVPFTVSLFSERIAAAALGEKKYLDDSRAMVAAEKPWLVEQLTRLGHKACPTDANFILVQGGPDSTALVKHLAGKQILIRDMAGFHGLAGYYRFSIGRREQNQRLIDGIAGFRP